MMNNEMIQNEVVMENETVEGAVEAAETKGGKTLAILAIGGLVALAGWGLYKVLTKNAAKANDDSLTDAKIDDKHYVDSL